MKKSKKTKTPPRSRDTFADLGRWGKMNYRDLQREAIKRGMPFPDVLESDMYGLISYIEKSIINRVPIDTSLIEKYDDWMDELLLTRGITRFPSLRLSYIQKEEDIIAGKMVVKKRGLIKKEPKTKKEKKPPRQKDEFGLVSGTKKSLVYKMVSKGRSLERILKKVNKQFPDSNEKSITIWVRKAEREINGKKKKKS